MRKTRLMQYLMVQQQDNINRDGMKSEKYKSVCQGIKNNDKYEIHTEVVKSGNEGIFNDEVKSEVVIEEAESRKEGINQCHGKFPLGGDIVKGEKHDIGKSTIITEGVKSGNKTNYADDIVIDPRERGTQINNNNDNNSDVAKIQNKNMNDIPYCSKIVREEKDPRDKDCTDDENSKSIEVERHRKLESVGRFTKIEDTECDNEHVDYSDISDTSTCTSIIQDGNMVHNSVPNDVSSDSEPENVIVRQNKKQNTKSVMKTRSECVLQFVDVYEDMANNMYLDSR